MGMNQTPTGERIHIGFFGKRNAGKSSLVNAVTGQALSVVSDVLGTTTDPVYKTMELLPLGPVVIIDTPGIDDEGELGEKRVEKAKQALNKCDIAVLVVDAAQGLGEEDRALLLLFKEKNIPYVIAYNKSDLKKVATEGENVLSVSTAEHIGIEDLKNTIANVMPEKKEIPIVADLLHAGDVVLLVTPIDEAAPKGRLILPQQQTIRDSLDRGAIVVTVKETELKDALSKLQTPPALVVCDSQVFDFVKKNVPETIPLTSFSILMARHKGYLEDAVQGIAHLAELNDGDTVLIAEGCTHHRQCNDIGTVKIPKWILSHTGKDITFQTVSGTEFPEDLTPYKMVIHCGGCMLPEREVRNRIRYAKRSGVPVTNYGVLIAHVNGILKRSIEPFPHILKYLEKE